MTGMASHVTVTGHCLCGAVRFSGRAVEPAVVACHCTMCQRQATGPFMVVDCLPGTLTIDGEPNVTYYKSSDLARRGFCKLCGSALFWRSTDGRFEAVSAGALDDKSGLRLVREVFIDEKPAYYGFANDTKRMTGAEYFASIASVPRSD